MSLSIANRNKSNRVFFVFLLIKKKHGRKERHPSISFFDGLVKDIPPRTISSARCSHKNPVRKQGATFYAGKTKKIN